jgi:8-oxo-dGTP pyrophosphatase MutT (NUDIX family)
LTADELRSRLAGCAGRASPIGTNRAAAVLVPIEPRGGVWLTRRTGGLPNHAGQVAFPGGKIEPDDISQEAAALREAQEEVGLDPAGVELLGRIDDHVISTGFHITPVTALVPESPRFRANPSEVVAIFRLDFATLLDPRAPQRRRGAYRGQVRDFWVWPHPDHVIWGATARILMQLARVLRGEADPA